MREMIFGRSFNGLEFINYVECRNSSEILNLSGADASLSIIDNLNFHQFMTRLVVPALDFQS